mgnify:CR=1 FL=1
MSNNEHKLIVNTAYGAMGFSNNKLSLKSKHVFFSELV